MHELAPLISDLAIMLGVAAFVTILFQRIHQPVVLGYLIAGIIIGPFTPPYSFVTDTNNIKILSELGVIFLMFSLGLEFSFQKLTRVGISAALIGLIEVVSMVLIGFAAGSLMGWNFYNSLFLGATLSISSTTIIIKAINDLQLKTKRFAELIFGVLIVEDLLAILLLVGLSTLVTNNHIISYDMLTATFKLILVVSAWFIIGYFVVPPIFREISNYINNETLTIISVALCLFLVCAAVYFQYSTALGAFIMGSILAETILIHRIEEVIMPIRDIFAAVFFISVGMLIDPHIIVANWPAVLFISTITIVGKIISTTGAALITGQSIQTSVRSGFGMAQIGEFSFIIAGLGTLLGVTDNKLYPLIVAVSAVTTFTTPYLIRVSGVLSTKFETSLPKKIKKRLQSYSAWVYRNQNRGADLPPLFTLRFLVNGLVVAIIFASVDWLIFHQLKLFSEESFLPNFIFLVIAVLLAAPFLWGMLFSGQKARFFTWLITFAEISILGSIYFETLPTIIFFFLMAILLFTLGYKQLGKAYAWFEKQLIANIQTETKGNEERYSELAPWETHLVEFNVNEFSSFIGKSLEELAFRQRFGVNIVAIVHGERAIPAPRGDEKIFSRDKLIVLGNDRQLESFHTELANSTAGFKQHDFLKDFSLKSILLTDEHHLVGKTIRDSQIREKINGMVVGLERKGVQILNPDPKTQLQADDLLLVVGEAKKIRRLKK